jgi:hypothetical protein
MGRVDIYEVIELSLGKIILPIAGGCMVYWLFKQVFDEDNNYNYGYQLLLIPIALFMAGWVLYSFATYIYRLVKMVRE